MLARRPDNHRKTDVGEKTSSVEPELTGRDSSLPSHSSCVVIRPGVVEKEKEVEDGTASPKIYRDFFPASLRGGGRIVWGQCFGPTRTGPAKPNCSGYFLPAATT